MLAVKARVGRRRVGDAHAAEAVPAAKSPGPQTVPQRSTRRIAPGEFRGLTPKQAEVFRFIYEHARDLGYAPSYREIAESFGTGDPANVRRMVVSMHKKGWLMEPDDKSRCFRFLRRPDGSPFTGFLDKP